MSKNTWTCIIPTESVPDKFYNKKIVLIKTCQVINGKYIAIEIYKNLGFNDYYSWQDDQDEYYSEPSVRGGCGSCWDYFAKIKLKSFTGLPTTFNYDEISKLDCVLIVDEDGTILNSSNSSSSQTVKQGATCKRCGDYNPYAECNLDEDFYCYSCRNGY